MGKIEKLIVLAVLFAAAAVLALSLNREKGGAEAADPLGGAEDLTRAGRDDLGMLADPVALPEAPPASVDARPTEKAPSLLLNAGAESRIPPAEPAPAAATLTLDPRPDPTRPILVGQQDLRPSFLDEYRLYTVAEGDTWSGLAQRFYQDGRYTRNLHLANEDLGELTPGKDILVPVYDLLAVEPGLQSSEADAEPSTTPDSPSPTAAFVPPAEAATRPTAKPSSSPTPPKAGLQYEVRPGDTLSEIALAALGGASRWTEILALNRDVLSRPEDLRVGMKLVLPTGAKMPATGAKTEKKSEPKPETKAAAAVPASSSKKKVL